jgi:hypothetical protein
VDGFFAGGVAPDLPAAEAPAVLFFVEGLLTTAFPLDAAAPDDTRDECFERWCTAFFGAASAIVAVANDATSVISNNFIDFRVIGGPFLELSGLSVP